VDFCFIRSPQVIDLPSPIGSTIGFVKKSGLADNVQRKKPTCLFLAQNYPNVGSWLLAEVFRCRHARPLSLQ
jgi:hypothetical protein